RDVKVEKGEERTLDLQLHPAATVHLFVVDPKGRPVAGRLFFGIHAKNEGGTRVGTSVKADDEGRATYRQIVPGPYSLRVLLREIGEAKVEVEILPGENRVEVRLE
ncbi:MAG: carboxypeptidase-like regulatory domain-containing protein, partial [Planctomycetota bacterium]